MKTQLQQRDELQGLLAAGHKLRPAPSGPLLPAFDPLLLAQGIEAEIARGVSFGWDKVTLHMTFDDAWAMAQYLRRKGA